MDLPLLIYTVFISLVWIFMMYVAVSGIGKEKREERKKGKSPRVLVVVPCKGYDIDLVGNLKSALYQDYNNYRVVAVIESKSDFAYKAIKQAGMDYIITDFKCSKCSAKVRSLSTAFNKFKSYDLYCILDSDVYAHKGWLSSLVNSMTPDAGIATSFPIFEPLGGFWSKVKHIWGFVGLGLMENERTRFGWGGSLLFRKELLSGKGMKEFSESVSDDMALTHLAKRKNLKIIYVPEAMPVVKCMDNKGEFLEWSTRQTAFSISGDRQILYYGIAFYSASILLLASGIVLGLLYSYLYLLLLLPFIIGLTKTYKRAKSSDPATVPIFILVYFITLYNLIIASRMEGVTWRGIYYRLDKQR